MRATGNKPISKTRLLGLLKDLDWRAVEAALKEHPDLRNYRSDKSENLLHLCCGIEIEKRGLSSADSIKMAGVLLDASFDIDREAFTEGDWKATPLWYAIGRGKNLALAKYLLERGADPEHEPPKYVQMLLEHGARLDVRNRDGVTAGDLLSRMRSPEYQKLAKEYC